MLQEDVIVKEQAKVMTQQHTAMFQQFTIEHYADAISHSDDDTVGQSNGTIEHNAAQYPT